MYMVSYALIVLQNDCVKEISEVGVRYDAFCNSSSNIVIVASIDSSSTSKTLVRRIAHSTLYVRQIERAILRGRSIEKNKLFM